LPEETALDVVKVENAEAALQCLRDRGGEGAMIFADIRLPGMMDGVQLVTAACILWPTIRVVLTSGAASERLDKVPESVAAPLS
jgi:DNA-binding LytR/AlgR family response regulator